MMLAAQSAFERRFSAKASTLYLDFGGSVVRNEGSDGLVEFSDQNALSY